MTKEQKFHGERTAARRAVNGQPNGYKPVSEAELTRERERQRILDNLAKLTWADYQDQEWDIHRQEMEKAILGE